MTHTQRELRHLLVIMATLFLVLFWAVPVTFVASLTTLQSLSSQPGLGWIEKVVGVSPLLKGFLEGFLPTVALLVFMAILPLIVKGEIGEKEGERERRRRK